MLQVEIPVLGMAVSILPHQTFPTIFLSRGISYIGEKDSYAPN